MKYHKPVVLFNASVIIAGVYNPRGGSGKLLQWVEHKKIIGIVSELILKEVKKHVQLKIEQLFLISSPPREDIVNQYKTMVVDPGDSHVLASASELDVDYLVSHDKKHILSLKKKIKKFQIVSTKELIRKFSG